MPRPKLLPLLLCLLLLPATAAAHLPGSSFLIVRAESERLELRWDVSLPDADLAAGLDGDGDGRVAPAEARAGAAALFAYAEQRLQARAQQQPCTLEAVPPLQLRQHADGPYLVLRFAARCPVPVQRLELDARLMTDRDPAHLGRVRVQIGETQFGRVFTAGRTQLRFEGSGQGFADYFREGVFHVLDGWDHLLFLLGLFLPAVLMHRQGRWQPQPSWPPVARQVLAIVSAFTLAHAATLCLAALGVLSLPSRLVESAVAATVLFTALNNLRPVVTAGWPWIAAGFGLIHGTAIAGALLDLGLPPTGRVAALLGFNLGVELAQLALVALLLPLAWPLRGTAFYRRIILWPGSVLIAAAGLAWLIDRAFALELPLPI